MTVAIDLSFFANLASLLLLIIALASILADFSFLSIYQEVRKKSGKVAIALHEVPFNCRFKICRGIRTAKQIYHFAYPWSGKNLTVHGLFWLVFDERSRQKLYLPASTLVKIVKEK